MPGSTPPISQLDWLISTTAMIVLSWSRATRDLLKSFGWGIRALHQLGCSDDGAISSSPAPYHLAAPVAQPRIRVFEAGPLAREHQKELVVEMAVIGQRQQGAAACEVADPIMRNVVGQSVAEIQVPRLEQQIDRVGADRADRVAVALPRQ